MTKKVRRRVSMAKDSVPSTEGSCPICHRYVKSLEAHKRAKHRGEK